MHTFRKLFVFIGLCVLASALPAQTVKNISLSHNVPFTDSPALKNAPEGVDLTAAFIFNEDDNTLTITLQSTARLFVFWEDIALRKAFYNRKLRTDRLTYITTGSTTDTYRECRRFRRAIPRPRCKYIFHNWADAGELQAVAAEHKMINDSITATFILPERSASATVRLRDILLISEVKHKGVSRNYELTFAGDINTEYHITLQRAPCLKMEPLIEHTANVLAAATRSYQAVTAAYPDHTVPREEDITMFNELKQAMRIIFPADTDSCSCQRLMDLRKQYNEYADSIAAFEVTLNLPIDPLTQKARRLDAKQVFYNARQLDANVSRWLASKDQVERSDLIDQNKSIISDTNELIKSSTAVSTDEKEAVDLFRKAEQYFYKSCK